jgi:hypothetical protein
LIIRVRRFGKERGDSAARSILGDIPGDFGLKDDMCVTAARERRKKKGVGPVTADAQGLRSYDKRETSRKVLGQAPPVHMKKRRREELALNEGASGVAEQRFPRRDNIASGASSSATLLRLQGIRKPGRRRRNSIFRA